MLQTYSSFSTKMPKTKMFEEKKNHISLALLTLWGGRGKYFFQQGFMLNYFICLSKSLVSFCLNVFLKVKLRF